MEAFSDVAMHKSNLRRTLSVETQDMRPVESQDICLVETQDMCCVES